MGSSSNHILEGLSVVDNFEQLAINKLHLLKQVNTWLNNKRSNNRKKTTAATAKKKKERKEKKRSKRLQSCPKMWSVVYLDWHTQYYQACINIIKHN